MAFLRDRSEYLSQAMQTQFQLRNTLGQLEWQQTETRREVSSLVSRSETALAELAAALLPDLAPATVDAAVALTGYRTMAVRNPAAELQQASAKLRAQITERGHVIEQELARIEAEPMFQNRLLLRAPRTGTLVREIRELEEFRQPFAETLHKCDHPRMQRLLDVEYGLPSYSVPFWRLSYYSDWKAADEISAQLGGNKPFAEVRSEYLSARDAVSVYDTKISKLRTEFAKGEEVERDHSLFTAEKKALADGKHPLQEQLAKMPEQFLKDARIQLERHLADLDLVMIGDRLQQMPQLELLAKRYYGLRKQTEYLRQTSAQLIDGPKSALEQTMSKLQSDINKYQRPKYAGKRFDLAPFDKMKERERRCLDMMQRKQQAQAAIVSFHAYEHGRLDEDFLWWDLITDGQVKANYIDEVARFKAMHPTYKYRRPKPKLGDETSGEVEFIDDDGNAAVAVIDTIDSFHQHHHTDFS
ncbi:MAG: hypothetical protein JNM40_21395 [Myxococcales bacterium]|nr:hypothetical protein [Myxococcales bacterium]